MFVIFPYLVPLFARLAGAGAGTAGVFFALYGVMGFLGNVAATQAVGRFGAFNTSAVSLGAMFAGALVWSLGAGALALMGAGLLMLGLGFAATNSMQQVRLVAAAPRCPAQRSRSTRHERWEPGSGAFCSTMMRRSPMGTWRRPSCWPRWCRWRRPGGSRSGARRALQQSVISAR